MSRRRAIRLSLPAWGLALVTTTARAGAPSDKAVYRGGTLVLDPSDTGRPSTSAQDAFLFVYDKGALRIPYDQVNLLEYGQKAGRRLGLAIVVSPLFLLSKKHRHYLTIGFLDADGEQQAAVFELGKKIVRSTIAGLEARTGLEVDFENEQARQAARR
ncbi:MAG: hypothetical protein KDC27_09705 [Acidobacteria bacterium]|nr:hypothetical protein [Acidobacteriota bacterium]